MQNTKRRVGVGAPGTGSKGAVCVAAFERGQECAAALLTMCQRMAAPNTPGIDGETLDALMYGMVKGLMSGISVQLGCNESELQALLEKVAGKVARKKGRRNTKSDGGAVRNGRESTEDLAKWIRTMLGHAMSTGKQVFVNNNGVWITATPNQRIGIGFMTPDAMGRARADVGGEDLARVYARWYVDHFARALTEAGKAVGSGSGSNLADRLWVFDAEVYERTGVADAVGPVLAEESEHDVQEGGKAVSGLAATMRVRDGNDEMTVGCVLGFEDSTGKVVKQVNLFGFPFMRDSDGRLQNVSSILDTWADRAGMEHGVAMHKVCIPELLICPVHRQLQAPRVEAASAPPDRPAALH